MNRIGPVLAALIILVGGVAAMALPDVAFAQQHSSSGEPGVVCWFELLTYDAGAASSFYADLFGWQMERGQRGNYLVNHEGALIGGITQIPRRDPDTDESTWLMGITVSDLPAAVAAARRLGAEVHRDVSHTEGMAQWAAIEDPQGAQVLLLIPERQLGGSPGNGSWIWAELWTDDPAASTTFYTEVIGWEHGEEERADGAYPTFQSGGEPRAGIVPIEEGRVDPGWAPYLGVADLAATLARAKELGGQVLLEPAEEVAGGRVAALADPTGVAFLVYELEEESR